jgi:hypothetical protein
MRSSPIVLTAAFVLTALLATSALADAPGVPTTKMWDKGCKELTLIGPADGSDLGRGKAQLMTGKCPDGTVIATGSCWS